MSFSSFRRTTQLSPSLNRTLYDDHFSSRCLFEPLGPGYHFVPPSKSIYERALYRESHNFISQCNSRIASLNSCNIMSQSRIQSSCFSSGFCRLYSTHAATEKKSQKMLIYLTGLVFAMVGCSYEAVPLYMRFCLATEYGGTVQRRESVEEKIAACSRWSGYQQIVVQFNADVADGMLWKFVPTQREVRVKPGESALAFYTAENRSSTPITGMSTYNVTPMKPAVYYNKTQCFCFEEQRLLPGEQIEMPVFFYVDPEFITDSRMDGINNLILSYTFFKIGEE